MKKRFLVKNKPFLASLVFPLFLIYFYLFLIFSSIFNIFYSKYVAKGQHGAVNRGAIN